MCCTTQARQGHELYSNVQGYELATLLLFHIETGELRVGFGQHQERDELLEHWERAVRRRPNSF